MSLHQIFLKDGDDVAVLIPAGPSVSDPCGLIGAYVRTFRVVFSRETLELVALQPLRALSTFEFDSLISKQIPVDAPVTAPGNDDLADWVTSERKYLAAEIKQLEEKKTTATLKRAKQKSAGPATDYVENLKTLPLDVLYQGSANTSMTDMWKFNMINNEIEDRKNR